MRFFSTDAGFSLVETLVAISILLIVITGPMAISMRTAKSSTFASEQVQAFFLAQEGLELAQKARDDLFLREAVGASTNSWTSFTNTTGTYQHCYTSSGCGLEWHASTDGALAAPVLCTATNCLLKKKSVGRSYFTYVSAGATPTIFTRRIYFEAAGDSVNARSVVTWRTGSLVAEQRVEVDTYLYNTYVP